MFESNYSYTRRDYSSIRSVPKLFYLTRDSRLIFLSEILNYAMVYLVVTYYIYVQKNSPKFNHYIHIKKRKMMSTEFLDAQ